jgi:hypothetical protein
MKHQRAPRKPHTLNFSLRYTSYATIEYATVMLQMHQQGVRPHQSGQPDMLSATTVHRVTHSFSELCAASCLDTAE